MSTEKFSEFKTHILVVVHFQLNNKKGINEIGGSLIAGQEEQLQTFA